MAKWRDSTIGAEATLQRGFDITARDFLPGRVPVISSGGHVGYHDTAMAKGPGVILGRKGTLGTVFFVNEDYWPHDTTLWVKDFHGNVPRFVYYFFKTLNTLRMDVGSANPTLNRNHVHPLPVRWPDLDSQREIAGLLGTLDEKIELNRRMNETLEAMARAIFKSWFVDFDPVRAKAAGRQPERMSSDIVALFPNKITDGIPFGWHTESLDSIADFLNGLALQKYPPAGADDLPVIKIAELKRGNTVGADRADAEIPTDYVVQDGDVLFSWSGSLEVALWCGGAGALNQHLFKVTSKQFPKWFYYEWLKVHLPEFQAIAAAKATTMGHIQRHHLSEAHAVVPSPEVLRAAGCILAPMLEQIVANNVQSRTLAALRDTLLPKLLSGEVRLKIHDQG